MFQDLKNINGKGKGINETFMLVKKKQNGLFDRFSTCKN